MTQQIISITPSAIPLLYTVFYWENGIVQHKYITFNEYLKL